MCQTGAAWSPAPWSEDNDAEQSPRPAPQTCSLSGRCAPGLFESTEVMLLLVIPAYSSLSRLIQ